MKRKSVKRLGRLFCYDMNGERVSRKSQPWPLHAISEGKLPKPEVGRCATFEPRINVNMPIGTLLDIAILDPIFLSQCKLLSRGEVKYMPKWIAKLHNKRPNFEKFWTFRKSKKDGGGLLFVEYSHVTRTRNVE